MGKQPGGDFEKFVMYSRKLQNIPKQTFKRSINVKLKDMMFPNVIDHLYRCYQLNRDIEVDWNESNFYKADLWDGNKRYYEVKNLKNSKTFCDILAIKGGENECLYILNKFGSYQKYNRIIKKFAYTYGDEICERIEYDMNNNNVILTNGYKNYEFGKDINLNWVCNEKNDRNPKHKFVRFSIIIEIIN